MSIKFKLLLAVGLAMVITGSLSILMIYNQNSKRLTDHLVFDTKNTVNYTSQLINFYLDSAKSSLTSLAEDPAMLEALETKDFSNLAVVTSKLTIINDVSGVVGNVALQEVSSTKCLVIAADKRSQSAVGVDFSLRDYCKGIIAGDKPYLSSAFINAVSKKPTLAFAVPVKNEKGKMLGFVVGFIDLSELHGYLWDLQSNSAVDLLDRNGEMFLTTRAVPNFLGLAPYDESEVFSVKEKLSKNIPEGYYIEGLNFIGYKFDGDITVIYEKPTKDLISLVNSSNFILLSGFISSIILVFSILVFFVGRITNRISRLSKITKEIEGGNFKINLNEKDLEANDETAVLARSFNEMAKKLTNVYKKMDNEVKNRTKEVEEKNKKLNESEIELKKALDLSEQTNKLMVGRELKMLELKEELRKLKK